MNSLQDKLNKYVSPRHEYKLVISILLSLLSTITLRILPVISWVHPVNEIVDEGNVRVVYIQDGLRVVQNTT